jgi:hypothetical protein
MKPGVRERIEYQAQERIAEKRAALGGVGGGQLLSALIPMMAGVGNNVDIGALASQAVGGGVAGAIVAAIVGLIKNKMAS